MKTIHKTAEPAALEAFRHSNPAADWNRFRADQQGQSYQATKAALMQDQKGLCAFCETDLGSDTSRQRIEHFHPKSDTANPDTNWALDWRNMLAVCMGGSEPAATDHSQYPTPDNLSCDAYKDHLITKNQLPLVCEGYLLNPLELCTANLFSFNRLTGKLDVDAAACATAEFNGVNQYASLEQLVTETIRILNLNCQRLCDSRLEVMHAYNRFIKQAREIGQADIHRRLTRHWFSKPWPAFFTTRRILLGRAAESYLQAKNYNG